MNEFTDDQYYYEVWANLLTRERCGMMTLQICWKLSNQMWRVWYSVLSFSILSAIFPGEPGLDAIIEARDDGGGGDKDDGGGMVTLEL